MTDAEQVILKAIAHAGRGGVAEISKVVRAVGYPKATTKKVLIGLAGQGIVTLYRHDYPGSLSPAERKLMLLWKGNYYNAVSARRKNNAMHPVLAKLNRRADKLKKPHMGEKGNQWRQLDFSELGDLDWPHIQRSHIPGVTIHTSPPPGVVWFPSSRNFKRRNPKGQHLPGLSKKAQREYEHVLSSELAMGRSVKRAKGIAAGKVRKDYAKNPLDDYGLPVFDRKGSVWPQLKKAHKAAIEKREKYERSIVDYARKLYASGKYTDAQIWMATWNKYAYQGDVSKGVLSLVIDGKVYKVNLAMPNSRRKKNKTIIKAKRVLIKRVCNPKKKAPAGKIVRARAKKAAKTRKRNLDHRDSTHQVKVHQHWRAGGLSQWQRAHHAGQHDLFSHGIKVKPKRNAAKSGDPKQASKRRAGAPSHGRKATKARRIAKRNPPSVAGVIKKAVKAVKRAVKRNPSKTEHDFYQHMLEIIARDPRDGAATTAAKVSGRRLGYTLNRIEKDIQKAKEQSKRNPTRKGMRKLYAEAKRVSKVTRGRYFSSESGQRKAGRHEKRQTKTGKRNPSPASIRKTFAGRYNKDENLSFPDGTPQGLAKLGRLVSIKTDEGKVAPVNGTAWLCSDTRGKLHIGTPTKGHVVFGGPAHNYGHVREIEYEESKPHLGYAKKTLFFHKLGEETGVKPRLVTDGKGGAKFVGGAYKIRREGIIN